MASVKGTISLPGGSITRLVDAGVGVLPRYTLEFQNGVDAMGVTRWSASSTFSAADVIAILQATGFIQ